MFSPDRRLRVVASMFRAPLIWFALCVFATGLLWIGPAAAQDAEPRLETRSAYNTLAELLEDEGARRELVEELRRLADEEGRSVERSARRVQALVDSEVADEGETSSASAARRIASTTQALAEGLVREATDGVGALRDAGATTLQTNWVEATRNAQGLIFVVAAVLLVFFVLRRLSLPIYARANRWAVGETTGGSSLLRRSIAVIGSELADIAVVLLAWVSGYLLALLVFGTTSGQMDMRQSLFLNAFVMVEVFKALIRMLFASRYDALRLLPMSAESAAYWNAWLARLTSFVGYGLMLAVPLIDEGISLEAGRLATLLIVGMAFLYAWIIVRQNRDDVRRRMEAWARTLDMTFARVMVLGLARVWHLLTMLYFAALAVVSMLRPDDALPFMVGATLQTFIAIGGGVFIAVVISQILSRRIRVPDETSERLPLLEDRLNESVPGVLKTVRLVILVVVLALVLDAWGAVDLGEWLASEAGAAVLATGITIGFILIVAKAVWIVVASYVEHRLNVEVGGPEPTSREKTLLSLFRNAFAVVLVTMTTMIVLSELGINIGPLIAGAGVIGLAVGFGAQKLVQDVITGVFIQLEQAINTGDVVTAGGITGVAEKVTVRSVRLRELDGTYHVVPFSSVDAVANFMRDFSCHVGDYAVGRDEDVDQVLGCLQAAFDEMVSKPDFRAQVIGDLEIHGLLEFSENAMVMRIRFKTIPAAHWPLGREYNQYVKRHFDAAGIVMPFPHVTLFFGEDKGGKTSPANLRLLSGGDRTALSLTRPEIPGDGAGGDKG